MRSIETKEDIEKKDRRNKIVIGVILVAIMILSTAGYAFFNNEKSNGGNQAEKVSYNGMDFYKQGEFWQVDISGNSFYFSYLPNETRKVAIAKTISDYSGKPLYFVSNGAAEQEIAKNLGFFASRMQQACIEYENCTGDLPVKNCSSNLIVIKEQDIGNAPIITEENCVYILSNDTIRDADAFLYKVLGIN